MPLPFCFMGRRELGWGGCEMFVEDMTRKCCCSPFRGKAMLSKLNRNEMNILAMNAVGTEIRGI